MAQKILIIEDDSFLQGLASRKLQSQGYEISIATDGEQGFKVLEKNMPDMILLDLLLPNIDGFEFLKRMRDNDKWKNIPVIVFSNLSEEKDMKKAMDLGVKEYMIKANFTLDELTNKVKGFLG